MRTKESLVDLNSLLFEELERLGNADLKGDDLKEEIGRASAITKVATQVINNANVALNAAKFHDDKWNADLPLPIKRGQVSWNKGKKGLRYSRETEFKKGNMPTNYRPVGTEVIDGDGYIKVKISDPKTWEFKHRLIWEKDHGPIPDGHVILIADGNKQNLTIDNLVLVSRRELLAVNRYGLKFEDTELTKSGLAVAQVIVKSQDISK